MKTPAGKECKHYYEDYNRGRNIQECRLIKANTESVLWRSMDCSNCPVPDILNANASPQLELKITVTARFLGFGRRINVEAFCDGVPIPVEKAYTGCDRPGYSEGLDVFRKALEDYTELDND